MAFVLEELEIEERECMQEKYKMINPFTGKQPLYQYRVMDEENNMCLVAVASGRPVEEQVPNVYSFICEDGIFAINTLEKDGLGELHIKMEDISYHELQPCKRELYFAAIKDALVVYHQKSNREVFIQSDISE